MGGKPFLMKHMSHSSEKVVCFCLNAVEFSNIIVCLFAVNFFVVNEYRMCLLCSSFVRQSLQMFVLYFWTYIAASIHMCYAVFLMLFLGEASPASYSENYGDQLGIFKSK